MNNDSERVLGMLSEGKITVDQAERLLEALSGTDRRPTGHPTRLPRLRLPISRMMGKSRVTSTMRVSLSGLAPAYRWAQAFTLVPT